MGFDMLVREEAPGGVLRLEQHYADGRLTVWEATLANGGKSLCGGRWVGEGVDTERSSFAAVGFVVRSPLQESPGMRCIWELC